MHTDHIVNQIQHHELRTDSTLHVIGVISNPVRYHARYRLFREWYEKMKNTANVKVYVVEVAFGDRQFEVTDANDPTHLQLRTNQELWHKENMINLGVRRLLPRDWKYLCWCDADVFFTNDNWALEAMHQLQHYPVIQPWSDCLDLGVYGNVLQHFKSFANLSHRGIRQQTHKDDPYPYGHSGFAWCCTRGFYEQVQKLMEFPILGSSDHHMAWGMVGKIDWSIHAKMSDDFKTLCHQWQKEAMRVTNGIIGYIPGRIEHKFHGPKGRRQYRERWQIFIDHDFEPSKDLRYDSQGLLYVHDKPQMMEAIRHYFRNRHEDSIEEH